jgi:hypothetical protein
MALGHHLLSLIKVFGAVAVYPAWKLMVRVRKELEGAKLNV